MCAQLAAVELYAGEHWSVARKFPALHRPGEVIRLWACSAGYGLIPAEAPIMPYHATLTPGQADSVPGAAASWWSLPQRLARPCTGASAQHPRARGRGPGRGVHVRAFQVLPACLRGRHRRRPRVHRRPGPALHRLGWRPAGGRPGRLHGPGRCPAAGPLRRHPPGAQRPHRRAPAGRRASAARTRHPGTWHALLAAQPPIPRYDRKKQSDREILDLIAERLAQAPATSANRLLREFRDAGLACEQRRFSQLYRKVAEATS